MSEPAVPNRAAAAGPETGPPPETTAGACAEPHPARILVVDDRAENRELLQASLEHAAYSVLAAANGHEALEAVARHRPDLILLDVMMPGLDGYEICRRLKADPETAFVPVIVVTALQDFAHRLRGIEAGADEFLTKPFRHEELWTRVRALLRTKRLHDQVAAQNRLLEARVAERTAALARALADLKELDHLKAEFLANVSHELRTPLTPLLGYLPALLREDFGPLTPLQRQVLNDMAASVDRLYHLIEDLLRFMERETGSHGAHRTTVHVPALIETGAVRALAAAREKGVRVLLDIPADLPPVWAHVDGLSRALGHVIENAVKFTPPRGSVTVAARRGAASRDAAPDVSAGSAETPPTARHVRGESVTVAVRDEGIGIPHDAIPRLFDPFYQVDGSSTREYGGTGLGLALTKRLVEQHGGRIWAESAGKWQGSTFMIVLPAAGSQGFGSERGEDFCVGVDGQVGMGVARIGAGRRDPDGPEADSLRATDVGMDAVPDHDRSLRRQAEPP